MLAVRVGVGVACIYGRVMVLQCAAMRSAMPPCEKYVKAMLDVHRK